MRIWNCRNSHYAKVDDVHRTAGTIKLDVNRPLQSSPADVRSRPIAASIVRKCADIATMDSDDLVTGRRLHHAGGRRYIAKLGNESITDITKSAAPRKIEAH